MCYAHISRTVIPMDFKLDRCLATGTRKYGAKFDVVRIRNAKDIVKYIGKRSTHMTFQNPICKAQPAADNKWQRDVCPCLGVK